MTDTTNDEHDRYAWARRPPLPGRPETDPERPEATTPLPGRPESDAERSEATAPLPAGSASTAALPPAAPAPAAPAPAAPAPPAPVPAGGGWGHPSAPAASGGPAVPTPPPGWTASPAPTAAPPAPTAAPPGPDGAPSGSPFAPPVWGGQPPSGPGGPGSQPGPGRQPGPGSRRPGWGGVAAMGIGAALLSSLLTAGLISATDDDTATGSGSTTSSQQSVPAPVTGSTVANPDWSKVARAVEPSVVAVVVTGQSESGEGSGVILNRNGEIVTNNHVVSGAGADSTVKVVLNDGRQYDASVVGTDPSTDLAVIKIKKSPSDLTPATLGSSKNVAVGDPVMAVGNPLGLAGTVTTGIVSATDRPTTTTASSQDDSNPFGGGSTTQEQVVTNAIQTDAAVNPGNSGGALVDVQGRVIGVPSSIASLGSGGLGSAGQSGSIGLGFAIPVDEVRTVAAQLAQGKTVPHSWLGVSLSQQDATVTVDGAQREAAVLAEINADSPASKAGLKDGDAVIKVDGEAVNSATSLVGQLREREPGTSVTLTVVRDGKAQEVKVTLGTRPSSAR